MPSSYFSELKYPKKSHRKQIFYPPESPELAEMMGILFGDGGINNPWQLVVTLNSEADMEYSRYVKGLLGRLFQIDVATRKRPGMKALTLVCSSTSLVEFLVSKGAVRGNKVAQKIGIPGWIKSSLKFQRAFIRGLVDTDGCLYIHRHIVAHKKYNNLGFCFSNYSPPLLDSVAEVLSESGIIPHITAGKNIYLYSYKEVEKYLTIFGTCNPRISKKYEEWTNLRNTATIGI